ncbi:MAG: transposase [Leptolyngbya sp. SIO3F4]|nr:transposase [Leptolyngbya sp. SIO3F4]
MGYRRVLVPGATYFFTVVTYRRQHLFADSRNVQLLRDGFRQVKQRYPFSIDAIVVLPDHIHAMWSLPTGDADYSMRWRLIKEYVSRRCAAVYKLPRSSSRQKKGEQAVWHRRFWEHMIRDQRDWDNHVTYIHFNPVKHGWVKAPKDWPYSSFHQYVKQGIHPPDWRE